MERKNIKGISLLELLLSLAVIGVLLIVATHYYRITREQLRVAQAVAIVKEVTGASYRWVAEERDFTGVQLQTLINIGLLPSSYAKININPWYGAVQIVGVAGDSDNAGGARIKVTLTNVPAGACSSLTAKFSDYGAICGSGTFSAYFTKP